MKRNRFLNNLLLLAGLAFVMTSCFSDLDVEPIDPDEQTANVVYSDPGSYRQVMAKLYAGLAVSGQEGPAGQPDIQDIDEGFSTYLRQYWKAQELTTDEAVIAWNDGNIHDYEDMDWDDNNEFVRAMYDRLYFQIALCNEFLRESTDDKLSSRGQNDIQAEVAAYRAEARFLRALSYWHALDMFRSVPFVVEADGVGFFLPEQTTARALFEWIENEIKDIEPAMLDAGTNEYGRADKAALWMLATKLYLNAEVYIGENRASEALGFATQVINAGYELEPEYAHLFLADNDLSSEIIFPVLFDGNNTRTWGGMTFIMHAAIGGDMQAAEFGMDGGWGGTRTTSAFVGQFPAVGGTVVEAVFDSGDYPLLNVPGAYQGWDPANDDTALTSLNSDDNYEGYLNILETGAIKFALGTWDENWGDSDGDGILEPGGDDITLEPGFYRIQVNLNDLTYTITETSWGLIGDATPGGWDADTDMTYNADENAWELSVDLLGGLDIKFRANDAWDVNLGDTGSDALLEYGGDNIKIPGNGNYTVKLYLGKQDYTYSIESNNSDSRKMFFTENQELEITDVSQFNQGYAITKWKNKDRAGNDGKDLTFPDTDFPMFRLADAYLMYAEAHLRGGGGDLGTAVEYVNIVRNRAGAGTITGDDLTLDFLLDERARELYWECHRRTDLVRFGQFTDGTYHWPLKGNSLEGTAVAGFRDIFPIPASDLSANPRLSQNPGY
ncbi:MAG: RagB/SusD family nutrient uptake outer membrane protein [Bacteroidota bacterium]